MSSHCLQSPARGAATTAIVRRIDAARVLSAQSSHCHVLLNRTWTSWRRLHRVRRIRPQPESDVLDPSDSDEAVIPTLVAAASERAPGTIGTFACSLFFSKQNNGVVCASETAKAYFAHVAVLFTQPPLNNPKKRKPGGAIAGKHALRVHWDWYYYFSSTYWTSSNNRPHRNFVGCVFRLFQKDGTFSKRRNAARRSRGARSRAIDCVRLTR
jgi:hypothetical protein